MGNSIGVGGSVGLEVDGLRNDDNARAGVGAMVDVGEIHHYYPSGLSPFYVPGGRQYYLGVSGFAGISSLGAMTGGKFRFGSETIHDVSGYHSWHAAILGGVRKEFGSDHDLAPVIGAEYQRDFNRANYPVWGGVSFRVLANPESGELILGAGLSLLADMF